MIKENETLNNPWAPFTKEQEIIMPYLIKEEEKEVSEQQEQFDFLDKI